MDSPVQVTSPRKVYPPVGKCIYCGKIDCKLTVEHIIPFGLGGNWELPDASCEKCAEHTGGAEQKILRSSLGLARAKLGFRSRKPKQRPTQATIYVGPPGKEREVRIPLPDHPTIFALPIFAAPGIVVGSTPINLWRPSYKIIVHSDQIRRALAAYGEDVTLKVGHQNAHVWGRMLAKIAHSYVVAERGLSSFRPVLLDLILERSETALYWVGGDPEIPAQQPHLHMIEVRDFRLHDKRMIAVRLRLFAHLGGPVYWVVVGETSST